MPTTTTNTLLIAFFDGIGESTTPTANFTPVSGFPLANLRNSQLLSRTRTPDLTLDRQLTWDWGVATEFNVFMLAGTNATPQALRRFRAADDSGFTTGVVESGATLAAATDLSLGQSRIIYTPPWGRTLIYVLPSSVTKRYTRWHQSDALNPDNYQEWGIARIGLSLQFPFMEWKSSTSIQGVPGSQKAQRTHEYSLERLTKDQAYTIENLVLQSLNTRRVLVIPEPLTPATYSDAIWCTFEGSHTREPISRSAYSSKKYKVSISFKEADQ